MCMKLKPHTRRKLIRLGILFVLDALFFSLVNPNNTYAIVIVAGYILLIITLYVLIDFLLAVSERIIPFSAHTKRRMAVATTLVLALLIAMQSIGQLTVRDILAVIPLVVVLSLYFSYMFRKSTQ
jgi:membrane-associated HD superfamily phosphohydrolase